MDARIKDGLGGHHLLLTILPRLGNPVPVTVMTLAFAVACLVTTQMARRRSGRSRGAGSQ